MLCRWHGQRQRDNHFQILIFFYSTVIHIPYAYARVFLLLLCLLLVGRISLCLSALVPTLYVCVAVSISYFHGLSLFITCTYFSQILELLATCGFLEKKIIKLSQNRRDQRKMKFIFKMTLFVTRDIGFHCMMEIRKLSANLSHRRTHTHTCTIPHCQAKRERKKS